MTSPRSEKEAFFDEHIAPMILEAAKLCAEKNIPMLASFQLDENLVDPSRDEVNLCTTAVLPKEAAAVLHTACRAILHGAMDQFEEGADGITRPKAAH